MSYKIKTTYLVTAFYYDILSFKATAKKIVTNDEGYNAETQIYYLYFFLYSYLRSDFSTVHAHVSEN